MLLHQEEIAAEEVPTLLAGLKTLKDAIADVFGDIPNFLLKIKALAATSNKLLDSSFMEFIAHHSPFMETKL